MPSHPRAEAGAESGAVTNGAAAFTGSASGSVKGSDPSRFGSDPGEPTDREAVPFSAPEVSEGLIGIDEVQKAQLVSYFTWLNENRDVLVTESAARQARRDVNWSRLAWWEFR